MARQAISPRLRFSIFKRDGFRCLYCGLGVKDRILVVDHITPVALGGSNHRSNLATACEGCNQGKADEALPPLYEEILRARVLLAGGKAWGGFYAQYDSVDEVIALERVMAEPEDEEYEDA